jgi:hypothetical protein
MEKIYIKIPYILKDTAKELGAKFDMDKRSWYITDETKINEFELIPISISYENRNIAKQKGCLWDPLIKKWLTPNFNNQNV